MIHSLPLLRARSCQRGQERAGHEPARAVDQSLILLVTAE